jgi:hypothetical protein
VPCHLQHMEAVLDFRSRIWVTYRRAFPEIGAKLTAEMHSCSLAAVRVLRMLVLMYMHRFVRLDIGRWLGLHTAEWADAAG